jgi:rhodanese-related sulfurtransferase
MPTKYDEDAAPIIQFDARLEISPFLVFRRLREGKPVTLVDVRKEPKGHTLEGSEILSADFEPPPDATTVLFDDDGTLAIDIAEAFQERGYAQVKALFGGLELWKFSLDPNVVGEHTYLIALPETAE